MSNNIKKIYNTRCNKVHQFGYILGNDCLESNPNLDMKILQYFVVSILRNNINYLIILQH